MGMRTAPHRGSRLGHRREECSHARDRHRARPIDYLVIESPGVGARRRAHQLSHASHEEKPCPDSSGEWHALR